MVRVTIDNYYTENFYVKFETYTDRYERKSYTSLALFILLNIELHDKVYSFEQGLSSISVDFKYRSYSTILPPGFKVKHEEKSSILSNYYNISSRLAGYSVRN